MMKVADKERKTISSKSQLANASNGALWLLVSTVIVNAANYGLNLGLARFLGPEIFAEANILATLVLVLSFIGVGIQLMGSKFVAEAKAEDNDNYISAYNRYISKRIIKIGMIITLVMIALSFLIKSYLQFNSAIPLIIIFIGIIPYLQLSHKRGILQGQQIFKGLALTYLFEMMGRLVMTFFLLLIVYKSGLSLYSEAIAVSFLISFFTGSNFVKLNITQKVTDFVLDNKKAIFNFFAIIGLYELSQILINNSDVLLMKHYFEAEAAGKYASLALIGRIVFFATWTIVTLLFPKVIEKEKKGESHVHLFWGAMFIVSLIGVAITVGCKLFDVQIMNLLFGNSYSDVSIYLWRYALATTLFACANVFAYYYMSLDKYIPAAFTLVAGLMQIVLIILFHASILEVIQVQIVLMACLFVSMCIFYISDNLKIQKSKTSQQVELSF